MVLKKHQVKFRHAFIERELVANVMFHSAADGPSVREVDVSLSDAMSDTEVLNTVLRHLAGYARENWYRVEISTKTRTSAVSYHPPQQAIRMMLIVAQDDAA